jgi:hypothetical protein
MSAGPFAHWSPLQTLLVWVLGTCVAAVVWYAVFYRAAHDEWLLATNDLEAARSDLEKARADRRRAEGRADELTREAEALASDRARVSSASAGTAEDLLLVVPELAASLGLQIDRWRPLPDEPVGALLLAPVEVDARGDWTGLTALLHRLATDLPLVVAVDRLAIRGGADGSLELRLVVGALRLRGAP